MTRKTRRELERAVEDMGPSLSVDEWIGQMWGEATFEVEYVSADDGEPQESGRDVGRFHSPAE